MEERERTRWTATLLGLLEEHTDDIAGERQAVNDYVDAFYAALNDLKGPAQVSRRTFYLDLLERTAWTAVQAAAAVLIETGVEDFAGWAVVRNAAILSVVKALVANRLPWTADNSASSLPAEVDPPANG